MNGNRCTSDSMRDIDHMYDNCDDLSSDDPAVSIKF